MHLRVQKHASESVKALIPECESIDSRVRKDASEGVGVLLLPYRARFSYDKKNPGRCPGLLACSFSALLRKRLLRRRAGLADSATPAPPPGGGGCWQR